MRAMLKSLRRAGQLGLLLLPLLTAGCGDSGDKGPLTVSVIGDRAKIVDPNRQPLTGPEAALMQATAQGLIRFDGSGQIEPGLAIRWDVSDDGLYYTFRLDDRAGIDADNVARRLRVAIARSSRNPLRPMLGAVDEIVAVTPEVIEIRLKAPRPNLLQILAQPELGLAASRTLGGTGPLRVEERGTSGILLGPIADKADRDPPSEAEKERQQVRLRGERAALAVARFRGGATQVVLGGRFQDLAVARAANLPANVLRFDPVAGLFGLAIVDTKGLAGNADARRALSMAIDRERIVAAFGVKGWRSAITLVPGGIADLAAPAVPDWTAMPLGDRQASAAGAIARLRADRARQRGASADTTAAPLRVALPKGPGARLLFALIRADWARIGVAAEAVGGEDDADLRLVDLVAPADTASWYLRHFTCDRSPACDAAADDALAAGREAVTLPERNTLLARADQALVRVTPFIPIASPLRWSLAPPQLGAFKENARGTHPLNHLRAERR